MRLPEEAIAFCVAMASLMKVVWEIGDLRGGHLFRCKLPV